MSLDPSDVAKDIEIPEAKLKEEYDQRQDELQIPERRDVEQILAPTEEKAKEAEAALAAGKDWREVATTIAGQDPDTIDLGLMRREEMPSALGEVAFDLPLEQAERAGQNPARVAHFAGRQDRAAGHPNLRRGQAKLEADLAHQEAVDRIYKVANNVDDALAGGATLSDAAAKIRTEDDHCRGGRHWRSRSPRTSRSPCRSPPSDVLKLAFATNEGQTSRVTEAPDGAIFALHVDKVIPSASQAAGRGEGQGDRGLAGRPPARDRRQGGRRARGGCRPETRLATVAAEKGLKATTSPPFTRHPENDTAVPPALVGKLFAAKPGEVVTASDAAGSYVAQLDEVRAPGEPAADRDGGTCRTNSTPRSRSISPRNSPGPCAPAFRSRFTAKRSTGSSKRRFDRSGHLSKFGP